MKRNLLFIMTDHQRADSIGMVQCGREVTPNLNRLAAGSLRFTRAYNTCPLCVPARTALATGRYPTENGVTWNDWRGHTAGHFPTIHTVLRDAGYRVAQVGVNHVSVQPMPREQGLDFFYDQQDYDDMLTEQGISPKRRPQDADGVTELLNGEYVERHYSNANTSVFEHPSELFKDAVFTEKALSFLDKLEEGGEERPFALFLYLWAPHPPLIVPPEYASLYDPQQLVLPENVGVPALGESPARRRGVPAQLAGERDEAEWRRIWAAHLGLVSYADHLLGKAIDRVRQISPEAAILFTVDHGEALGQQKLYQKMEMYEPSVRIPLLLNLPGEEGKELSAPVSHLDVLPTLCDLLELSLIHI